jgi:hemolysin activation/secretion protein
MHWIFLMRAQLGIFCRRAWLVSSILMLSSFGLTSVTAQPREFPSGGRLILSAEMSMTTALTTVAQAQTPQSDLAILPELKGLKLVDSTAKLVPEAVGAGVMVDGLPLLENPKIRASLSAFLGKPFKQSDLAALVKAIVDWYAQNGHPYASVSAPSSRDVTSGVIQVVVLEDPVILPKLSGIKIINNVDKLNPNGINATGLVIENLPKLDNKAIRDKLTAFIGKPLTRGGMAAMSRVITDWYDSVDRPFVNIAIPPGQDVTNGVIQVVVAESHVGKINVVGNEWFSSDMLVGELQTSSGGEISRSQLKEDADWLTRNPFHHQDFNEQTQADGTYRVTIKTAPGAPGYTDLTVNAADQFPLVGVVQYDNYGNPALGRGQWTYGVDWGNALWLDQQLSYRYITSDPDVWHENVAYRAHALAYTIPLPWHDTLILSGSYALSSPRLGPDIGLTGVNDQLSLRYDIGLPAIGNDPVHQIPIVTEELQFGYDFKSSNNNLLFGGAAVSNTTTDIDQFTLIYNAAVNDRFGQTSLVNDIVFSPGNLTGQNKDSYFAAQTGSTFAKVNYLYDHLAIDRTTQLPSDLDWVRDLGWMSRASWLMKVVYQISDRNLLPSEQMGIGGAESVPGYDEHLEGGSDGYLVSEELRTPPFSVSANLSQQDLGDRFQFAAFWDYARVHDLQVLPDETSNPPLESAGVGLYAAIGRYADFRMNYGWQLRVVPGIPGDQFGHVSMTLRY